MRIAARVAEAFGARLVAVNVLDRLADVGADAQRIAAAVLYEEAPGVSAEARGEVGDVAERLAAVADDERATLIVRGARSRGRAGRYLRARCAAELTSVPIVIAPLQLAAQRRRKRGHSVSRGVVGAAERRVVVARPLRPLVMGS